LVGHRRGPLATGLGPRKGTRKEGSLMLFVIIGHEAPAGSPNRPAVRPAHLEQLRPLSRAGRVKLTGPFLDRPGRPIALIASSLLGRGRTCARSSAHTRVSPRVFSAASG